MTASAWKYEIEPYCGHGREVGVVLDREELPDSIPKDKITWIPLYSRSNGDWVPTRVINSENDMKCYTDLEGTIEAKEGDRVALVIQDEIILRQPNFLNRPIMSNAGGIEFKQEEFMEDKQ